MLHGIALSCIVDEVEIKGRGCGRVVSADLSLSVFLAQPEQFDEDASQYIIWHLCLYLI